MFGAVVYRPPHSPFIQETDFIDKITTLMHDYCTEIIVDNFNADQLYSSAHATVFAGLLMIIGYTIFLMALRIIGIPLNLDF